MQTEGYKTNQMGGARAKLIRGKNEINRNYIYQDYNPNINTGRNNEPRDSYSKIHIESRNNTNLKKGTLSARHNKGYSLYNRIPQLISFEDIYTKKRHLKSNIDIEKENLSEYVEIPKEEYQMHANKDTFFMEGGMNTGRYKFRGEAAIITEEHFPSPIGKISEEQIMQEIARRTKKKEKKIKYEVMDKFYTLTEFERKTKEKDVKDYEIEIEKKGLNSTNKKGNYQIQLGGDMQSNSKTQILQNTKSQAQSQVGGINIKSKLETQVQSQSQIQNQAQTQVQSQSQIQNQAQTQTQTQTQTQIQAAQSNKRMEGGIQSQIKMNNSGSSSSYQNQNINFDKNINIKTGKLISPIDNYSKYLLEQINKIRIDPQSFIGMIEDAKANIIKYKNGGFVYNGKIKIALSEGYPAFNEAIEFLKNTEAMEILEFSPQITPELPKSIEEIKDVNDLKNKVENMVNEGINIRSYWKDIIRDPEISFLLMIVDDHGSRRGRKRKDILNPKMKYIGISSVEINGNFVCYITLSPAKTLI